MRIILNDYGEYNPLEIRDGTTGQGDDLLIVERNGGESLSFTSLDEFSEFLQASKLIAPSWWREIE